MSGSAQEGDAATAETGPSPSQDLYREKPSSTTVRVLTVFAYLMSVSLAAILLSVYYICIWKSPVMNKESNEIYYSRRGDHSDYEPNPIYHNPSVDYQGGSNPPVTSTAIPHALDNFTDVSNANENNETTTNVTEDSSLATTPRDNETTTETKISNGTKVT